MPVLTPQKEGIIRKYKLSESSSIGSSLFEIIEAKGEFIKRKADFLIPHRKDYYLIVFVKNGSSRHWVDFTPYTLKPDTLYFTTPPQVHLKEQSAPLLGTLISFTAEFMELDENKLLKELPVIQNPENLHELNLTAEDISFLEDIFSKMLYEFKTISEWKNSMLLSYLKVLLIYMSRLYTDQVKYNESSPDRFLLKKFRLLIEEHFVKFHQVSNYADLLNITPGHLNDSVKSQSGKTAIEHIHERIILEAKRKLLHTDLSVKEIAYSLNFEDTAYFNRFFKRLTSGTPAAFRSSIREMYH
ncbi:helix-turn-helix domain-containing protein [Rubrolithibacter danxiaensis]|uniref:helix-turn-helix domain-containing protein n=1 Tax=Rubrolithibacter danxiaensis TaxID=3390805 RepID=UPI003BF88FDF